MFYDAAEINEHLICPYCQNKFNDPRLIECGVALCMPCIELLKKHDASGFKCLACGAFHEMPANGFFKISSLANLCQVAARKDSLADALKTKLDEVKLKLDMLSSETSLQAHKIKEHSDGLRNAVQLSSEQLIEAIKAHDAELVEQISDHERSSILDFNQEHRAQIDSFIQDTAGFHSKWISCLKQAELDDAELQTAANLADACISELNRVFESIPRHDSLQFESNSNSATSSCTLIGTLRNLKIEASKLNLWPQADFRKHQLPNFSSLTEPISVRLLSGAKIVLAYRALNKKDVKVKIFDADFKQLSERTCITGRNFKAFELSALPDQSVMLCLTNLAVKLSKHDKSDDEDCAEDYSETLSVIKHYDAKLKILNRVCLYYDVCSVDTFENKLYCLSRQGFLDMCLHVYDEKLVNLMNIESNPFEPFYIPSHVNKVQVSESYFVYRDDSEVVLLDRTSGWIKKRFQFEGNEVLFDSGTSKILAYSSETNKVVSYDLEGESQSFDVNIPSPNESIQFVDCLNGKLLFWDAKSDWLYF
jgi:hypothetical protein